MLQFGWPKPVAHVQLFLVPKQPMAPGATHLVAKLHSEHVVSKVALQARTIKYAAVHTVQAVHAAGCVLVETKGAKASAAVPEMSLHACSDARAREALRLVAL